MDTFQVPESIPHHLLLRRRRRAVTDHRVQESLLVGGRGQVRGSTRLVIIEQRCDDPFHVYLILLVLLLLSLLLLLLKLELLPPQKTRPHLLRVVRGGFGLFLEMSPPVVFYLVVSSSW